MSGMNPSTTIGWTATFVTGAWLAASLPASAAGVEVTNYEVTKEFEGAHATDLSGIACVPLNQGEYRCLVIDDESKFAQLAKIENGAIEAKAEISADQEGGRSQAARQKAFGSLRQRYGRFRRV